MNKKKLTVTFFFIVASILIGQLLGYLVDGDFTFNNDIERTLQLSISGFSLNIGMIWIYLRVT